MRRTAFGLVATLAGASPELAAEGPRLVAVEASVRPAAALPGGRGEVVTFGSDVAARLLEGRADRPVLLEGWPTRPGERASVLLERMEVYAPDARIVVATAGGFEEVPRSRLVFFRGEAAGDPTARLLVSVHPDTRRFEAMLGRPDGLWGLRPLGRVEPRSHLLAEARDLLPPGAALDWTCAQDATAFERSTVAASKTPRAEQLLSGLHVATVAVDTDNELMLQKFTNSTTTAGDYVASLFAAMNVVYERDLNVRLLQGFTILRPSSIPDPYVQAPDPPFGTVSSAQLAELTTHWSGGCGGACATAPRALVVMLSGKQPENFTASGRAGLGGLCGSATGSFNQVFKFSAMGTVANDVMIVAHEIGHNFGSDHTHCYPDPKPDTCYNGEAFRGCYADGQSCPASATYNGVTNVTGTLMSYCHLSGLAGCSSSPVFHPATVSLLDTPIAAAVGSCLFPATTAASLFAHGFETPPTSTLSPPWSGTTP